MLYCDRRKGSDSNEDDPCTVVTTTSGYYGAGVMLILNELFATKDKWVIPSSVHEVIVTNKDGLDIDSLTKVINDINALYVDDCDVLSDHPYDINDLHFPIIDK